MAGETKILSFYFCLRILHFDARVSLRSMCSLNIKPSQLKFAMLRPSRLKFAGVFYLFEPYLGYVLIFLTEKKMCSTVLEPKNVIFDSLTQKKNICSTAFQAR